jgi:hypothetical protein
MADEVVMRPYEPTLRERLYYLLSGADEKRPSYAREQLARGMSQMVPLLGLQQAGRDVQRGDLPSAALETIAALPVVPGRMVAGEAAKRTAGIARAANIKANMDRAAALRQLRAENLRRNVEAGRIKRQLPVVRGSTEPVPYVTGVPAVRSPAGLPAVRGEAGNLPVMAREPMVGAGGGGAYGPVGFRDRGGYYYAPGSFTPNAPARGSGIGLPLFVTAGAVGGAGVGDYLRNPSGDVPAVASPDGPVSEEPFVPGNELGQFVSPPVVLDRDSQSPPPAQQARNRQATPQRRPVSGQENPEVAAAKRILGRVFSGNDYQSNSDPVVRRDGSINWGTDEQGYDVMGNYGGNAADFFRADAARMAMQAKEREQAGKAGGGAVNNKDVALHKALEIIQHMLTNGR